MQTAGLEKCSICTDSEDISGIANKVGYGLMDLRHFGPKKEFLEDIQDGIKVCELLEEGWKAFHDEKDIRAEAMPASVYMVTKAIRSGQFLLRPKHFEKIANEAKDTRRLIKVLLANPEGFPKNKVAKCQAFFATVTGAFLMRKG